MAKVLVVRKPDRTIHQMPLANKAVIMGFSNRLPLSQQYKFEEMDEKEAAKLPYIDPDYVTVADAQDKIKEKDKELADKDKLIKQMEEKLSRLEKPPINGTGLGANTNLSEGKAAKGQK